VLVQLLLKLTWVLLQRLVWRLELPLKVPRILL
jgi:hypothetical protein